MPAKVYASGMAIFMFLASLLGVTFSVAFFVGSKPAEISHILDGMWAMGGSAVWIMIFLVARWPRFSWEYREILMTEVMWPIIGSLIACAVFASKVGGEGWTLVFALLFIYFFIGVLSCYALEKQGVKPISWQDVVRNVGKPIS